MMLTEAWRSQRAVGAGVACLPLVAWLAVAGGQSRAQEVFALRKLGGSVAAGAFSPDGRRFVLGFRSGPSVRSFEVASRQQSSEPETESCITEAVAVSPDGRTLAFGFRGGKGNDLLGRIRLFDLKAQKARSTLEGHETNVKTLAYSPNGRWLVSGNGSIGAPGDVNLWDLKTDRLRAGLGEHDSYRGLAFSKSSKLLAISRDYRSVVVWEVERPKLIATLRHAEHSCDAVSFGKDDTELFTASGDGAVHVWDLTTKKLSQTVKFQDSHFTGGTRMVFSPDVKLLASWDESARVEVWDVTTGARKATLEHSELSWVQFVAFSCDSRQLLSGARMFPQITKSFSELKLWDLTKLPGQKPSP